MLPSRKGTSSGLRETKDWHEAVTLDSNNVPSKISVKLAENINFSY